MSTDIRLSNFVDSQVPQYLHTEGPNLIAFIKAYYEWAEQANNSIEVSRNLTNYQDIDLAYDKYFEYFHREIMSSIPRSVLVDKKLLAKNIKDLYRAKGSELSYRMLFRILYGEEIEFYYPGQDILRASDGRWVVETSIRIGEPKTGDLNALLGQIITGETSGAIGKVNRIAGSFEAGQFVTELFITNTIGTFIDNERVRNNDSSITATIINTVGPVQDLIIVDGGALHRSGDSITLTSQAGLNARGTVSSTTDTSALDFEITNGGSGYRLANTTLSIIGGSGTGAALRITSLSNTENLSLNSDFILPLANVPLNTGNTFVATGANTSTVSANLAAANSSTFLNAALLFSNVVVGTINSISTDAYGYGYSALPSVVITDDEIFLQRLTDGAGGFKGGNAIITPKNAPGAITNISVTTFGLPYNKSTQSDNIIVQNTTRAAANAEGIPEISGVVTYQGKYTDTKGFLSWNNKLQDNFYYQAFSYELSTSKAINQYRRLVNSILHPAGIKMFGRLKLSSSVALAIAHSNTTFTQSLLVPSALTSWYFANNQSFDEISFSRSTTAYSANSTGLLVSNAIDAYRLDHNPNTLVVKGLLIEPSDTNMNTRSDPNNGSWQIRGSSKTANYGVAPDGTTTSSRLTALATTDIHIYRRIDAIPVFTNSLFYCMSGFVKAGTSSKVALGSPVRGKQMWGWFDLSAGTAHIPSQASIDDATAVGIEEYPNGWYRIWVTCQAGTTVQNSELTYGIVSSSYNGTTSLSFTATGTETVEWWGFQVEEVATAFSGPSSFIATSGSAVSRAADVATIDLNSISGFANSVYTVVFDTIINNTDGVIAEIGSGANNEVTIALANGSVRLTGPSSLNVNVSSPSFAIGDSLKVGVRVGTNKMAICVNGNTVFANTAYTPIGSSNTIQLGNDLSGDNGAHVNFKNVYLYNTMTNNQLIEVTS